MIRAVQYNSVEEYDEAIREGKNFLNTVSAWSEIKENFVFFCLYDNGMVTAGMIPDVPPERLQ